MAIGAVNIAGLKGEALANALMKAETKSKRRATLSICGLGMLDETEVEDLPDTQKRAPAPVQQARRVPSPSEVEKDDSAPCKLQAFKGEEAGSWVSRFLFNVNHAKSVAEMESWVSLNAQFISVMQSKYAELYTEILDAVAKKRASFAPKDDPISSVPIAVPAVTREGPSMEGKGYDTRFTWALSRINSFTDGGEAETWWSTQIEPDAKDWMPPDLHELAQAYEAKLGELNSDGQ